MYANERYEDSDVLDYNETVAGHQIPQRNTTEIRPIKTWIESLCEIRLGKQTSVSLFRKKTID